jgi:D-galactarolactone cycloisomerase
VKTMEDDLISKRDLLRFGGVGVLLAGAGCAAANKPRLATRPPGHIDLVRLRAAASEPVIRRELITQPVRLKSLDLLERDGEYMIRAEDSDGAVGWALANIRRFPAAWPIFLQLVAPQFIGKDMRDYERHLEDAFIARSNYKWQGLALWICFARAEIAILDLIGQKTGQPVHALIGGAVRNSVGVYYANGNRDNSAQWVVDRLKENVEASGAKAVKFKVGARMRTTEKSNARDRELIPLMREAFGPDKVIYADANSSYTVEEAIYFGRMMEAHDYGFFEEPVRWDDEEGTRRVAEALSIPIAGGEQESSVYAFERQIMGGALQIVQPDLIYFGGLVRSKRIARMAEAAGLRCVPHISGYGLGQVTVTHFACTIPNTTDYQEYKGDPDKVPYELINEGGRLKAVEGRLKLPQGPGLGVRFDPDWLAGLKSVA